MNRKIPFALQILLGFVLGALAGTGVGPAMGAVGFFGKITLSLIKALATPLLFFAIVDSLVRASIPLRAGLALGAIAGVNALLALGVGLAASSLFRPGERLRQALLSPLAAHPQVPPVMEAQLQTFAGRKIEWAKAVEGFFPDSVLGPFVENAVLPAIALALLFGLSLKHLLAKHARAPVDEGATPGGAVPEPTLALSLQRVADGVHTALKLNEQMLGLVLKLVPFAVFAVVAKTVGERGLRSIFALGPYVGVALLGLLIQVGVVYSLWIRFGARRRLREFWQAAREPVLYAMGASSSLATLPVTLEAATRLKIRPEAARLSACVGTNFNNDGILLYEAMAVLFVAQAHGYSLSLGQQLLAALGCVVAGVGIAGVPEAGLISLSLVLTTVGLPTELLPLLLSVDWVLSRARAMTNVTADLVGAAVLDRWLGGASTSEAGGGSSPKLP